MTKKEGKRDKLALELAEALVKYAECYPAWKTHTLLDKARELLELYSPKQRKPGEKSPPDSAGCAPEAHQPGAERE